MSTVQPSVPLQLHGQCCQLMRPLLAKIDSENAEVARMCFVCSVREDLSHCGSDQTLYVKFYVHYRKSAGEIKHSVDQAAWGWHCFR